MHRAVQFDFMLADDGSVVFRLASDHARRATGAGVEVDHHAPLHVAVKPLREGNILGRLQGDPFDVLHFRAGVPVVGLLVAPLEAGFRIGVLAYASGWCDFLRNVSPKRKQGLVVLFVFFQAKIVNEVIFYVCRNGPVLLRSDEIVGPFHLGYLAIGEESSAGVANRVDVKTTAVRYATHSQFAVAKAQGNRIVRLAGQYKGGDLDLGGRQSINLQQIAGLDVEHFGCLGADDGRVVPNKFRDRVGKLH